LKNNPYTHRPIIGKPAANLLPKGTALVLEGGGLRGYYSAGVLDALLEADLQFPYIAGVSAGAANGLSYVSGQLGRGREIVKYYVADKRYVSKRNMLLHGSMFNMDFVFHQIPQKHLFFDWDAFNKNPVRYLTGATDCQSGETKWFEKQDLDSDMAVAIASCSIPLISPIVNFRGMKLLDGGITAPIPIEKSIEDGNTFHLIVLTRNRGYTKKPMGHDKALRLVFKKYPMLAEALKKRHEVYNRQLALCETLEKQGKALIIRPLKPLEIDRMDSDTEKLLALYDEGVEEGRAALAMLKQKLNGE
jgi:Predicted esterase of the alpha-beta hydrolase superfamily